MNKKKLAINFLDAWARKDKNTLATCISRKVKCQLIDKGTQITSRDEFLKYASAVFKELHDQDAEIIPVYCKNNNYYELIYSIILQVAFANGVMITCDEEQEANIEIRRVFIKMYVHFKYNLFKIKLITFSDKEIL